MTAIRIALATLFVFVLSVCALCAWGQPFLRQMTVCDAEVSYLDLARQASDSRDYATADAMYKQALIYARQHDTNGQMEQAMLLTYAKFACEKKNDLRLAAALQKRAQELRLAQKAHSEPTLR